MSKQAKVEEHYTKLIESVVNSLLEARGYYLKKNFHDPRFEDLRHHYSALSAALEYKPTEPDDSYYIDNMSNYLNDPHVHPIPERIPKENSERAHKAGEEWVRELLGFDDLDDPKNVN